MRNTKRKHTTLMQDEYPGQELRAVIHVDMAEDEIFRVKKATPRNATFVTVKSISSGSVHTKLRGKHR